MDPDTPESKYDEIIEMDWQFDCGGRSTMDMQLFMDAMFLFIDNWVEKTCERYAMPSVCVG